MVVDILLFHPGQLLHLADETRTELDGLWLTKTEGFHQLLQI